jgi:predicted phage terminase large subunit-like protein
MEIARKLDLEELRKEYGRTCMKGFIKFSDAQYRMNWHHALICDTIDDFIAKKIKRLMIFAPPRHGKSEIVSRKLPAFIFGQNPAARVIATSYSADLAMKMSRDVQRIMISEEYQKLFPDTAFGTVRTADFFEVVNPNRRGIRTGEYRAAGVGGGITGMGGDYIIIDDPVKNRQDANSQTYRENLYEWYTSTLFTRLQKGGCILLTVTRWHEDDLAGRLLANNPRDWTVVNLPAVCEDENANTYDKRRTGEALWEDEFSAAALEEYKRTVGGYDWAALYQQRPTPGEGGLFNRAWWRYYTETPTDLIDWVQSWDCTFKDTDESDYVVGQVWARSRKKPAQRYLIDQVRGRMTFTETIQEVQRLTAQYPQARRKLIEDKANGTAVIDVLNKRVAGIIPVNPHGGKVVRAQAVTAYLEAGNVFIPSNKEWIGDFVEEFAAFPNGKHDDQVDAMTQANMYYNKGTFSIDNLIR